MILEQGDKPGNSYSQMHQSLKLLTPACYSNLPGLRRSSKILPYYSKNELVDYYDRYVKYFKLPIHFNSPVKKVTPVDSGYQVMTDSKTYFAKAVVCATGQFSHPHIPELPGLDKVEIPVMHSSEYDSPEELKVKFKIKSKGKVLVAGGGNTGIEIATELADAGFAVSISSPRKLNILPHQILGLDIHFLARPVERLSRLLARVTQKPVNVKRTPVLNRQVLNYIKSGTIQLLPALKGFKKNVAVFDSQSQPFDAVILATGYRYQTPYLTSTNSPGIFFVGKPGHYGLDSAYLRGINLDARHVVNQIKKIKP